MAAVTMLWKIMIVMETARLVKIVQVNAAVLQQKMNVAFVMVTTQVVQIARVYQMVIL